jgi:hypothetical protein
MGCPYVRVSRALLMASISGVGEMSSQAPSGISRSASLLATRAIPAAARSGTRRSVIVLFPWKDKGPSVGQRVLHDCGIFPCLADHVA